MTAIGNIFGSDRTQPILLLAWNYQPESTMEVRSLNQNHNLLSGDMLASKSAMSQVDCCSIFVGRSKDQPRDGKGGFCMGQAKPKEARPTPNLKIPQPNCS